MSTSLVRLVLLIVAVAAASGAYALLRANTLTAPDQLAAKGLAAARWDTAVLFAGVALVVGSWACSSSAGWEAPHHPRPHDRSCSWRWGSASSSRSWRPWFSSSAGWLISRRSTSCRSSGLVGYCPWLTWPDGSCPRCAIDTRHAQPAASTTRRAFLCSSLTYGGEWWVMPQPPLAAATQEPDCAAGERSPNHDLPRLNGAGPGWANSEIERRESAYGSSHDSNATEPSPRRLAGPPSPLGPEQGRCDRRPAGGFVGTQ
jgi:hypothetical protein